jgi:cytochrome oxidase Cu insertion factor (SCO1/SenC/PrrC family)
VPGMNSGLSPADPTLVAAFRSALLHQGAIALIIIVFLGLLWATARTWRPATAAAAAVANGAGEASGAYAAAATGTRADAGAGAGTEVGAGAGAGAGTGVGAGVEADGARSAGRRHGQPEARARSLLRIGFGLIWVLDGILQAQPKMAGGLASQVIEPTAAASPTWVQHVVNWGGTIWSYHPITAGAASVWIQVGIGAWLLVAVRGPWSRLAGLASVGWGLTVWVFGESFGGIFAPGLSWLTGAPGAVLIYVVAGALIALPDDAWRTPRLGRLLLGGIGLFFIGMAVLQAWPGRGFWQGTIHGQPGTLSGMVQSMSSTPQPHFLSALLARFGSFAASNGFAVNLVVVIALTAMGVVFLTGRPRLVKYAVWFGIVFCLADWVLVEDLGFLGGLGTDPNSMIPWILLFSAGYLALTPTPQEAPAAEATSEEPGWRQRLRPKALGSAFATASIWSVAAVAALAVVLIGAVPMAAAATNRTADPILALAIEGNSSPEDYAAPAFQLTDQNGQPVSLASLHGKVVLMTFLDPVCTTDCPIIGAEFKEAGVLLGAADKDVELVAIVANPAYRSIAFTQAFDREDGLNTVPNWLYLTGSLNQLSRVWQQYGVSAEILPAGAMVAHSELALVIDRTGHIREETSADPGPATNATQSSYSVMLAQYAQQALRDS